VRGLLDDFYLTILTYVTFAFSQNPQCEGVHIDRTVFDAQAPSIRHILYQVKTENDDGNIILEAGEAHGITDDAQFTIYEDLDMRSKILGTLTAHNCGAFTSKLKPTDGDTPFHLDKPAYALQTRIGVQEDIRVYIEQNKQLDPLRRQVFDSMNEGRNSGRRTILLVSEKNVADLILTIDKNEVIFELSDPFCRAYGLTHMPFRTVLEIDTIFSILTAAAHFYWHLGRSGDNTSDTKFAQLLDIQCFKLEESDTELDDDLLPLIKPVGQNLVNSDSIVDIDVEDNGAYGFKIVNKSQTNLYVSLFYFDMSDLSISKYSLVWLLNTLTNVYFLRPLLPAWLCEEQ
jgi:hypothetical protein